MPDMMEKSFGEKRVRFFPWKDAGNIDSSKIDSS